MSFRDSGQDEVGFSSPFEGSQGYCLPYLVVSILHSALHILLSPSIPIFNSQRAITYSVGCNLACITTELIKLHIFSGLPYHLQWPPIDLPSQFTALYYNV